MNKQYLINLAAGASYFTAGIMDHSDWADKYAVMVEEFDTCEDNAIFTACEVVPGLMAALDYLITDLQIVPQDVPAYEFWETLGRQYSNLIAVDCGFIEYPAPDQVAALLRERLRALFLLIVTDAEIEKAVSLFHATMKA